MDATQNVNLDGGGEGAQTSAGLNSVNSTGLEGWNSGFHPRAEENPDVRLPTLNIERLDPAMIEGLNALSDEDVFEEARGEIYLPENLAANRAEAAKSKEGDNVRKNSALDTQMKRLGATNASGMAENIALPSTRRKHMTLDKATAKYKDAVEELEEVLKEFQVSYQATVDDKVPDADQAEANKLYRTIRLQRCTLELAWEQLMYHLDKNADVQRKNEVKKKMDELDTVITGIKFSNEDRLEAFTSDVPIRKEPEQSIHQSHVGSHDSISRRQTIRETRVHEDLNEQLAEIEAQKREEEIEADRQKALRDAQSERLKEQANMALTEIVLEEEEQRENGGALPSPLEYNGDEYFTAKDHEKHLCGLHICGTPYPESRQVHKVPTHANTQACQALANGRRLLPNALGLASPHRLPTREQPCHGPSLQQQQFPNVPSGNQGQES